MGRTNEEYSLFLIKNHHLLEVEQFLPPLGKICRTLDQFRGQVATAMPPVLYVGLLGRGRISSRCARLYGECIFDMETFWKLT